MQITKISGVITLRSYSNGDVSKASHVTKIIIILGNSFLNNALSKALKEKAEKIINADSTNKPPDCQPITKKL